MRWRAHTHHSERASTAIGHFSDTHRCPCAILQVDKADPEVFNVLLQVLDDGRITDGQGRTVNFKNTIIILTSNIGAATIVEAGGDPTKEEEVRLKVLDQLRGTYRPEFLNRLDEIVIFNPLRKADLRAIARLTLTALTQRLTLKDISLEVSDRALDVLTDLGYSPEYGARPLKRVVQKELETPIARGIISGEFNEGDTVVVDADLDAIRLVIEKRSGGGGEEKGPSAPMAGDLAPAA